MCSPQWSASPPSVSSSLLQLPYKRPLVPDSSSGILTPFFSHPSSIIPPASSSPPLPPPPPPSLSSVRRWWGARSSAPACQKLPGQKYILWKLSHNIFRFTQTCEVFMSKDSEISSSTWCSAASSSSPAKINSSCCILMKHWAHGNYSNRYWITQRKLRKQIPWRVWLVWFSWGCFEEAPWVEGSVGV